jgi:hypothetical protein
MVTEQEPVPEQAPDQPEKIEPVLGVGVRVTTVPELYGWEQSEPQVMPAGDEVTVPVPMPALVTVRVYCCCVKLALMVCATITFVKV